MLTFEMVFGVHRKLFSRRRQLEHLNKLILIQNLVRFTRLKPSG
jgi:hypothetical protein